MSLSGFIGVPPEGPETFARYKIILDICSALHLLHANNPCIVHGDLKGSNVFVELLHASVLRANLIDVGISCLRTKHAKQLGGTQGWMAPEISLEKAQRAQLSFRRADLLAE